MVASATCPECRAHFSASDEASAITLRDAHLKTEHGPKVDAKTLAYIEELEGKVQALTAEVQRLKKRKKGEADSE